LADGTSKQKFPSRGLMVGSFDTDPFQLTAYTWKVENLKKNRTLTRLDAKVQNLYVKIVLNGASLNKVTYGFKASVVTEFALQTRYSDDK